MKYEDLEKFVKGWLLIKDIDQKKFQQLNEFKKTAESKHWYVGLRGILHYQWRNLSNSILIK